MAKQVTASDLRTRLMTPSDREICIKRVFKAPPDRVRQAFAGPDQVKQWCQVKPFPVETVTMEPWDDGARVVITLWFRTTKGRDEALAAHSKGNLEKSFKALDALLAKVK